MSIPVPITVIEPNATTKIDKLIEKNSCRYLFVHEFSFIIDQRSQQTIFYALKKNHSKITT